MTRAPAFQGAIFDLDGTLIDSMHVWEKIDRDFLCRRGIPVPEDYVRAISALSFPETARYTIARFGLPETPESLMDEWCEMAAEEYGMRVALKAGAGAYLARLKAAGVRLATATSLSPALALPVLRNNGVLDRFDALCTTDEVPRGKDFPDIFLLAARKLGLPPDACVVFEDILPAVRSAKSAGMRVYAVEDGASAHDRNELRAIADGYLTDFSRAPLP